MITFCYIKSILYAKNNAISKKFSFKTKFLIKLQDFHFRSIVYSKHYTYGNYTLVRATKNTVLQR